jgi:hypothetical protein
MSSAQSWTLIGGFLAIAVAMNALVLAIVRSEIDGLRREMLAKLETLATQIEGLRSEMVARFESVYRELREK